MRARGYAPLRGAAPAGGSVVDPCWRVDTRPYEALRFGTLAQPISILPQGDRKFSILPFQFSIQQQDGGQSLAALRLGCIVRRRDELVRVCEGNDFPHNNRDGQRAPNRAEQYPRNVENTTVSLRDDLIQLRLEKGELRIGARLVGARIYAPARIDNRPPPKKTENGHSLP